MSQTDAADQSGTKKLLTLNRETLARLQDLNDPMGPRDTSDCSGSTLTDSCIRSCVPDIIFTFANENEDFIEADRRR